MKLHRITCKSSNSLSLASDCASLYCVAESCWDRNTAKELRSLSSAPDKRAAAAAAVVVVGKEEEEEDEGVVILVYM